MKSMISQNWNKLFVYLKTEDRLHAITELYKCFMPQNLTKPVYHKTTKSGYHKTEQSL